MKTAAVLGVFAASGALSALAFPPFDLPWAIWAGVAPAMVAAVSSGPRVAAVGGLVYGAVFVEMLLWWLFGLFGWAAAVLHLILASFYALIFAGAQAATARWGRHALLWAAPLFWVGAEFFRSECWWLKFSWFGLGYSQHANVAFLQSASVVGVYGLSLAIAATNGAIAWFLLEPRVKRLVAPLAAAAVIGAMHAGGSAVLHRQVTLATSDPRS
jgi:apolipoprotein N-acyltransferase